MLDKSVYVLTGLVYYKRNDSDSRPTAAGHYTAELLIRDQASGRDLWHYYDNLVNMGRTTVVVNGPRFALTTKPIAKDIPNLLFAVYAIA